MNTLRVAVVGAGAIGSDHAHRIDQKITGARVACVMDTDLERARRLSGMLGDAEAVSDLSEALELSDALMVCTPGRFHEEVLLAGLEAGKPIFCEKPLTPDSASALRVLEAEQRLDRPHIQVGFMRRFDAEYADLHALVQSGSVGQLLMLHAVHRNATPTNEDYTQQNLIDDSVVHEFDVLSWLAGAPIRAIEVRQGRKNTLSLPHLSDPILVLIYFENGVLADVEMNVSVQFGYQVATEAVFESGVARIGEPSGLRLWRDAAVRIAEHMYYDTRFAAAFDTEVQRWVDAVREGRLAGGPTAWDGFQVALACEAGVQALRTGERVEVPVHEKPAFYTHD